jgi:hypothetical protein
MIKSKEHKYKVNIFLLRLQFFLFKHMMYEFNLYL